SGVAGRGVALAAPANTALLLLVPAARSVYGMAAAGVLPTSLARVNRASVPVAATAVVLGVLAVLVGLGGLQAVAALTDAVVLLSFMLVDATLPRRARRRRPPPR